MVCCRESPLTETRTTAENLTMDNDKMTPNGSKPLNDMSDVKPGILEMIQEEQRVSRGSLKFGQFEVLFKSQK